MDQILSLPPLLPPFPPSLPQGKGDMVTYWLEGKQASVSCKDPYQDPSRVSSKKPAVVPDSDRELYSSMPGFLNHDLLLDPA